MGFSAQQYKKGSKERAWTIHPIWRGIGCLLLVIVPIMSWFTADLVLNSTMSTVFPYEFSKVLVVPFTHVKEVDKVLVQVNQYFQASHFMFGQVFLTVIFSFIGFGIIALLYAIVYRVAGPPRYGPFDIPPNQIK